jgi:hypothetical protein
MAAPATMAEIIIAGSRLNAPRNQAPAMLDQRHCEVLEKAQPHTAADVTNKRTPSESGLRVTGSRHGTGCVIPVQNS